MKKLNLSKLIGLVLFLSLFFPYIMISQTYISPTIGRNYSYLEGYLRCAFLDVKGSDGNLESFKNNSWFGGMQIQQYLTNSLIVSFESDYTTKMLKYKKVWHWDYDECDSINPKEFNYKQLNSSIMLHYVPVHNWYISAGISARYYFDAVFYLEKEYKTNPNDNHSEYLNFDPQLNYDWVAGFSYNYKNLLFNFNYRQSIKHRKMWRLPKFTMYSNQTPFYNESFDISVSYLFKIFDKRKKRSKVNCPKM